jgi:flagellin
MKINATAVKNEQVMSQSNNPISKETQPSDSESKASSAKNEDSARLEISDGTKNKSGVLTQVLNNTQDGVSLLQTADKALDEIHSMLQQGKELAAKATKSQNVSEKEALQNKMDKINQKIDQLSKSTQVSNNSLLDSASISSQDNKDVITALKSDWLEEAEKVIEKRYGLTGDGADLKVVLDENYEPYLAAIVYNYDGNGKAINQTMHIAVKTALPATLPNGGSDPGQYDDRVITHEMVHVVMGRTMNFEALPNWFKEGTAEFIHGPDERVDIDLARSGGGMKGAKAIQDSLGDGTNNTWANTSLNYSGASMAVRYLHEKIKEDGYSGGVKDLLTDLKVNPTENLDQALNHVSRYASVKAFVNDYVKNGKGAAFINKLDIMGEFENAKAGGDTGAIGGADADGGPVQTAESVIPDINHPTNTPLKHFHVDWSNVDKDQNVPQKNKAAMIQNKMGNDKLLSVDSSALDTDSVDLVNKPEDASTIFDKAISYVANKQAQLGEIKNKLSNQANHINETINHSSIQDSDMLQKKIAQVKTSLSNSSAKIVSKITKSQSERVLQLLKSS